LLLIEAIRDLDNLPWGATLFAELIDGRFSPTSQVLSLELTDGDASTPIAEVAARRAPGKEYFLSVGVAREARDYWWVIRGGERLEPEEATRIVIYYAENHTWPEA
jgi:hypothetical protein